MKKIKKIKKTLDLSKCKKFATVADVDTVNSKSDLSIDIHPGTPFTKNIAKKSRRK